MVTVFLAEGFEEIEAITPIDVLRRAGVEVRTCSITRSLQVTGAHGIPFLADTTIFDLSGEDEMMFLPGGMPGTVHLKESDLLRERILSQKARGGLLAAICAAPTVFGEMGLLKEEVATCYPGMEDGLHCREKSTDDVVFSGQFITSRGAGTAFSFALKLVSILKGEDVAENLAQGMCFKGDWN